MRKFLFIVGLQIVYYLVFVFATFQWDWFLDWSVRWVFIVLEIFVISITVWTILWFDSWKTPEWLKDKTHQQKKTTIKQYIWELHEELNLYWEAMELQRKIKEFKNK